MRIFIAFCFLFMLSVHNLSAITADEVLQGVENRYVGKTSKSTTEMKLIDSSGNERKRDLFIYRRKIDNDNKDNFIHFTSPSDMKGTTYLVNEKNREKSKWIYLSAFKNIRKIVASDFGTSFVSSDFTYEDMDDIHASDYTCTNLTEEKLDGEDVYSIECVKKTSDTAYSRSILKVSKEKMIILKGMFFDKKDTEKQVKEATAKSLEKIQEIWTPKQVTMRDLRKNTMTVLEIKKAEYDLTLEADIFTERNMKK
ncbi:MAG: outer membrane lipoprotein-sorting protein [Candidatus Riflebacteria bacterium]|nr:outer membrane lipoprotein-sorting protein [Candidatus Riflebacteria bacterium]